MPDLAVPYFLARPRAEPPWPGVVVAHEGPGISPQLLRWCQRLAAEGYAVIAPDLYFRRGGTGAADFMELMQSLTPEQVLGDLAEARDVLTSAGAAKVGITGFCNGGLQTYRAATRTKDFAAAVGFYGARIAQELGEPTCPTLLFYGADDPYIPTEEVEAVRAQHGDNVVVYDGATHGFMRDGSDAFHETAAADAWQRLLDFFGTHLR